MLSKGNSAQRAAAIVDSNKAPPYLRPMKTASPDRLLLAMKAIAALRSSRFFYGIRISTP
jgi:hypothetical protein